MKIKQLLKLVFLLVFCFASLEMYFSRSLVQTPAPKVAIIQPVQIASQPPATAFPTSNKVEKRTTLMFTGDMNLGRCVASTTIRSADYTYPFKSVAETLRSADITVGSLDGSLSDAAPVEPCPQSMNLIGPQNMVQGLQFAGFDVITVATNHIKDCGEKGFFCNNESFFDTLNTLSQAGIQPVGGGVNLMEARKAVVIEKHGIRFAFLGINQINQRVWATADTPGVVPLSPETMEQVKADIASAKAIANVVIVLPQWGTEYSSQPDAIQRQWAQEMINAGATLVIGNHPHIIQPMESFPGGTAFYALGNFIFDQGQNSRREGMVVQAVFKGSEIEKIELLTVEINYYTYQPVWTNDVQTQKILLRVPDLSQ